MTMFPNTRLSLLAAFVLLATSWHGEAAEEEKASITINQREFALDGEITKLKQHPWAGKYYHGDGIGVNITMSIAPENGFVFLWRGCLGEYGKNYGTVAEMGGQLKLSPVLPNNAKTFRDLSVSYLPVAWGERSYLVATNEVVEFCNAINGKFEPRKSAWGMFLLRQGDEKKPAVGRPGLPKEFRKYLLEKPIEVTITTVGEPKTRAQDDLVKEFEIGLDGGSKNGLFVGMELHFVDKEHFGIIKVKSLSVTSSQAVAEIDGKDEAMPATGLKLSTLPPWHDR